MRFRCGQEASEKPDRRRARRSGGEGLDRIHAPLLPQEKILINGELVEGAQPPPGSAFSAYPARCSLPPFLPLCVLVACNRSSFLPSSLSSFHYHPFSPDFCSTSPFCFHHLLTCLHPLLRWHGELQHPNDAVQPPAFATHSSPVRQHPKKSEAWGTVRTSSLRCCSPPSNLCRCTRCRRAKRGR